MVQSHRSVARWSIRGGGGTEDTAGVYRSLLYIFDQNGVPQSHVEIQPTDDAWITYQLKNTPDGGFILTGVTTVTGFQDIFLLKTDSTGQVQWWHTYGHPTRSDYSSSVDLAPDGGYYIGGFYPQTASKYTQWVVHTDSAGAVKWQVFPGLLQDGDYTFNASVLSTQDSALVFADGLYDGSPNNHTIPQLVKLDTAGNELWNKTYGEAEFGAGFFSVAEVPPTGDLIACGQKWYETDGGFPYRKGILLRANSDGDSLWMREYLYYDSVMTDGQGDFRDVQPTSDGGFVAVGEVGGSISGNNPPNASWDVWVVKVDSLGCIEPGCNEIPLGITTQITNLKDALSVAPNPVASGAETTVRITLPAALRKDPLRLSVVSANGQLVAEAQLPPNAVTFTLTTARYASGLYHLHLTSGSTWVSGAKLVVE